MRNLRLESPCEASRRQFDWRRRHDLYVFIALPRQTAQNPSPRRKYYRGKSDEPRASTSTEIHRLFPATAVPEAQDHTHRTPRRLSTYIIVAHALLRLTSA